MLRLGRRVRGECRRAGLRRYRPRRVPKRCQKHNTAVTLGDRFDSLLCRFPVTGVARSVSQWIEFLYGPIFRVIGFFYRIYTANRARLDRVLGNARVAGLLRALAVLLLIGWILVWYLAPEDNRHRLTDEIKQTFGMDDQSADR